MIYHTDVLVELAKGNREVAAYLDADSAPAISIMTYMELLQAPSSKHQNLKTKRFIKEIGFKLLDLSQDIGRLAASYVDSYGLSHGRIWLMH